MLKFLFLVGRKSRDLVGNHLGVVTAWTDLL